MEIRVPYNTTAIDVAFNLSGSLTGFPVVIYQIPAGERVGFDKMPRIGEDVTDPGQTWTPNIQGMVLDFDVPSYNTLGVSKAPFSTPLPEIEAAISYGQDMINTLYDMGIVR